MITTVMLCKESFGGKKNEQKTKQNKTKQKTKTDDLADLPSEGNYLTI